MRKKQTFIKCWRCGEFNLSSSKTCWRCGAPLSGKEALAKMLSEEEINEWAELLLEFFQTSGTGKSQSIGNIETDNKGNRKRAFARIIILNLASISNMKQKQLIVLQCPVCRKSFFGRDKILTGEKLKYHLLTKHFEPSLTALFFL